MDLKDFVIVKFIKEVFVVVKKVKLLLIMFNF